MTHEDKIKADFSSLQTLFVLMGIQTPQVKIKSIRSLEMASHIMVKQSVKDSLPLPSLHLGKQHYLTLTLNQ